MKQINNYNEVEATEGGSFKRLAPGGYVCRITRVEDKPEKEYLWIEYDISEGEFKDWWVDTMERFGYWGGKLIRSYKDSATSFFKGFITAVSQSNLGYTWDWNEQTLVGKFVGLVLAEEEYTKNDGSVGTRLYVARNTDVANIRAGKFEVPALKKLNKPTTTAPTFAPVDDTEELPFL